MTNSFTAFAFAPGELKTTIPCSAHLSTGILFVPAPALPIANSSVPNAKSCIFAERTRIPVGFSTASPTVYLDLSNKSVPQAAILFSVKILYMIFNANLLNNTKMCLDPIIMLLFINNELLNHILCYIVIFKQRE